MSKVEVSSDEHSKPYWPEKFEDIFCEELDKQCKRDTGEDWPKITDIQNVEGMFWISSPLLILRFIILCTPSITMDLLNDVIFLPLS